MVGGSRRPEPRPTNLAERKKECIDASQARKKSKGEKNTTHNPDREKPRPGERGRIEKPRTDRGSYDQTNQRRAPRAQNILRPVYTGSLS